MKFKRKILRGYLKWLSLWEKVKKKIFKPNFYKLSTYQIKAAQLWNLLLKDKESMLHYSNITGVRQIHKKEVLVSLHPGQTDYYLTIIDLSGQRNNLYEITIRQDIIKLTESFDEENDRRMRHLDFEKRSIIYEDLDFLLERQEKLLQKKKI